MICVKHPWLTLTQRLTPHPQQVLEALELLDQRLRFFTDLSLVDMKLCLQGEEGEHAGSEEAVEEAEARVAEAAAAAAGAAAAVAKEAKAAEAKAAEARA